VKEVASGVKEIWCKVGGGRGKGGESFTLYTSPFTLKGEDGEYRIFYYAQDNVLNQEVTKSTVVILDNTPPEIYLTFPSTGNTGLCRLINGVVEVTGRVYDMHLKWYRLDYRRYEETEWQIAISTKEKIVEEGVLGYWDTTGLEDGWYVLRLIGQDCVKNKAKTEVEVYIGQPEKLLEFGGKGKEEGEFNHPGYIALDKEGNIYVTDTENDRIQKFSSEGEHLLRIGGAQGKGKGNQGSIFNKPTGIAVDEEGFIYVADRNNDRVVKIKQEEDGI